MVYKKRKPELVDDQQLEESNGNAGKTAATNKVIVHILECIVILALVMKTTITALKNAENQIHVGWILPEEAKHKKILQKALRTQSLTALTINFGFVGLGQYAW